MTKQKRASRPPAQSSSLLSGLSSFKLDLFCVGLLYLITLFVFREIVFDKMAFSTRGDSLTHTAISRAGTSLQETEGEDVIWMPYFFSGMPTFGNLAFLPHDVNYGQKYLLLLLNLFYLNGPATWFVVFFFLGGTFMFLLARSQGFERPVALFASVTFMLSPYMVGLAGEGHGSKLITLIYFPLLFLLVDGLFKRRDLLGFGLLAAVMGTFFLANHLQIVYYGFIILGLYILYRIVVDYKANALPVAKSVVMIAVATLIGLCISSYVYLSVYEYAQYSMRGGGTTGSTGGLAWDYATNWSWHPTELITLFVPAFYGLKVDLYWGNITPWTNSTVYVGLVPLFFAGIALVYRRNSMTIFLAGVTLLAVVISMGRNFALLYDALFSVLPFFNKFRAPVQFLHLLPFLLGLLAAFGFSWMRKADKENHPQLVKRLLTAGIVLASLAVLSLLLKSWLYDVLSGSLFVREGELGQFRQQYGQQADRAMTQIKQMRFDLFWKDLLKFCVLGAVITTGTWMFLRGKLQGRIYAAGIVAITVLDLWAVSTKYINPEPPSAMDQSFRPDATVNFLNGRKDLFRIFPAGQLFMDNTFASHGLSSIGGYSPAKLRIYQTLLDSCLEKPSSPGFPWNRAVLDMLNARYLLIPGRLPENPVVREVFVDEARRIVTYENPGALPRAWYARNVTVAGSDGDVFAALNAPDFNPGTTAILYQKPSVDPVPQDSTRSPKIAEYRSRAITIDSETEGPALMVLSEVYYPAGWKAFVDDVETEILRTNYILRSVLVPGGKHTVVLRYDPPLYRTGWLLSNITWVIVALCVLFGLWQQSAAKRRSQ